MTNNKIKLYKPEKYKVVVGNANSSVALCTCWNDPSLLCQKYSDLMQNFALIGSLYSREGASILIRNLALNPFIKTVILWGNGRLSQTAIGSRGKDILRNLWNDGREMNVSYIDEIQKEIDPVILAKIMRNIQILDMSDQSIETVLGVTKEKNESKVNQYMEPKDFPDPAKKEGATMPSELANFSVRGKNIIEAWMKALDRVYRYGYEKNTQAGIRQKELVAVSWTIETLNTDELLNFEAPDKLKSRVGLDKAILEQYANIFLDATKPQDVVYTYGNRLRSYNEKLDQVEEMIKKIKEESITRRAFATTFNPILDKDNTSPPCLISIQILIGGDNKMHLISYFRSHDMFKAALPNAYGLINVHKYIASHTGFKTGTLTIHSTSAHIYEDDWEDADHFLKCAYWERLKLYFDEHDDIDPRGVVRIELIDNKIYAALIDGGGTVYYETTGQTAKEVALRFARLSLLSRSEHFVDLTMELVKAEIALRLNKTYIQDKPILIEGILLKIS
jgi:thymidylate synthase